jgi:hypothetical protein
MEVTIAEKKCRVSNQSALNKLNLFLESNRIPDHASEPAVRKALLPFVETKLGPNEWILYDGNSVWNVARLTKQFKTFVKYYDYDHFTKYLYEFFHLQCGSIAHYNKMGWLSTYPTLDDLKAFFMKNEYGSEVQFYPPEWHYDARLATQQMTALLFGKTSGRHAYPK